MTPDWARTGNGAVGRQSGDFQTGEAGADGRDQGVGPGTERPAGWRYWPAAGRPFM